MHKIERMDKFILCAHSHKKRAKVHIQHKQKSIIFAKDTLILYGRKRKNTHH